VHRALRSLTHFRKASLAVALGAAVATAVLTGALLTGDSVRGSLRDLTLERLGGVDLALVSEHFFREELAAELERRGAEAAPLVVLRGTAVHGSSGARAAGVAIYGVDARFARLHGASLPELTGGKPPGALFSPIVLNDTLGRELGVRPGDDVLLSFERPGEIPSETVLGERDTDDVLASRRFTVARVLPDRGLGSFGLTAQQVGSRTAFVLLPELQDAAGRPGEVNALLAGRETVDLRPSLQLEDLGLRLVQGENQVTLESEELFLQPAAAETATALAQVPGTRVFTYLATKLRTNGRLLPYSMVSGLSDGLKVEDGEILLNQWAADDLQARPGDTVEMSYLVIAPGGGLLERTTTLRLRGIVGMSGLGADRTLTPRFPGIEDADDMSAWSPPFPVDLSLIRPQDEQYWDTYGAAPKAFVSLATARRLWSTRFGDLTAVRFPAADPARLAGLLRREIPRQVPLEPFGLAFQPVKRDGLAAAEGSTDFAGLFLAFSFFLILSSVLLVGLLFSLAVERRVGELGLLLAVGFRIRDVRRSLLAEGALMAGLGALLGLAGAVAYAWLLMAGLRTWWLPAVGTPLLFLHVTPASLAIGWTASVAAVLLAIVWTVRRLSRLPPPALLAGSVSEPGAGRPGRLARWLAPGGAAVAAAVLLYAGLSGDASSPALWLCIGACLLASGLSLAALWLRRPRPARHLTLQGMAARNAAANPGRSLLAVALVACACFVLVTVAANRREAVPEDSTHAGGFPLFAESAVPLIQDPGNPEGRLGLGLTEVDEAELQGVSILSLRVVPGDDVSCLNLYRPTRPRLLGAPPGLARRAGLRLQKALGEADPWSLGEKDLEPGVIPALADANSATWILKLGLGDEISLEDEAGRPVRLRLVGLLERSLFQSELLIPEADLLRHFPSLARRTFFLIDAPEERTAGVTQLLEEGLGRYGFDVSSTAERLASYHAVEDTYLSTFQALGGLGLLLGTFGLGVALLRSLIERRGELATLRAFGFRRSRIAAMVVAENGFLLLLGVLVGTVSGLLAVAPHLIQGGESLGRLARGPLLATILAVLAAGLVSCAAAVWSALQAPLLPVLKEER
jgi:putative ABC transport system permease protein